MKAKQLLWCLLAPLLGACASSSGGRVEDTCEVKGGQLVDKVTGIAFELQEAFAFDPANRYALLGEKDRHWGSMGVGPQQGPWIRQAAAQGKQRRLIVMAAGRPHAAS